MNNILQLPPTLLCSGTTITSSTKSADQYDGDDELTKLKRPPLGQLKRRPEPAKVAKIAELVARPMNDCSRRQWKQQKQLITNEPAERTTTSTTNTTQAITTNNKRHLRQHSAMRLLLETLCLQLMFLLTTVPIKSQCQFNYSGSSSGAHSRMLPQHQNRFEPPQQLIMAPSGGQQQQQHQSMIPHQQPSNSQQQDWGKRLANRPATNGADSVLMLAPTNANALTATTTATTFAAAGYSQPTANPRNGELTSVPFGHRPASLPAFLSDLVANSNQTIGQRLLRNLVNTTIADLVPQSAGAKMMLNSLNNNMMMMNNGLNNQPTQQQVYEFGGLRGGGGGGGQNMFAPATGLRYPAMNRLYSFLFPNSPLRAGAGGGFLNQGGPSLNGGGVGGTSSLLLGAAGQSSLGSPSSNLQQVQQEPIQFSSSDNRETYLSDKSSNNYSALSASNQIINLSAPYESRPRASSIGSSSPVRLHSGRAALVEAQSQGDEQQDQINFDGDRRSKRHRLNPVQQQQHHDADDQLFEATSGGGGSNELSTPTEDGGSFRVPENAGDSDSAALNSYEINQMGSFSTGDHSGSDGIAQEPSELLQYAPESDFGATGGQFGSRTKNSNNNSNEEAGRQEYDEAEISAANQTAALSNEAAADAQHQSLQELSDGSLQEATMEPGGGGEQFIVHHQQEHGEEQQAPQQEEGERAAGGHMEVQAGSPQADELLGVGGRQVLGDSGGGGGSENGSLAMLNSYATAGEDMLAQQAPNFRDSFHQANDTTGALSSSSSSEPADESGYLTIQLPSQYDSVIRIPPEGYYDDYFKPATSSNSAAVSLQAPSSSSSATLLSATSQEALGPEFALHPPSGDHDHRNNSGGSQLEEHRFELLETAANSTMGQQQYNHTHHQQVSAPANGFGQADYSKQYYLNQRPLKQNETLVDQGVEFIVETHNRTSDTHPTAYGYEGFQQQANSVNGSSNAGGGGGTNEPGYPSDLRAAGGGLMMVDGGYQQSVVPSAGWNETTTGAHNSTTAMHATEAPPNEQDSIQLILANTNSSRDPLSNEKVINYTSEGHSYNVGRLIGKPARNTFVNKEMNEFLPHAPPPPAVNGGDGQNYGPNAASSGSGGFIGGTNSPVTAPALQRPRSTSGSPMDQLLRPAALRQPNAAVVRRPRPEPEERDRHEEAGMMMMLRANNHHGDELLRVTPAPPVDNNSGRHPSSNQHGSRQPKANLNWDDPTTERSVGRPLSASNDNGSNGATSPTGRDRRHQNHQRNHQQPQTSTEAGEAMKSSKAYTREDQQQQHHRSDRHHATPSGNHLMTGKDTGKAQGSSKRSHKQQQQQQQTFLRPQVTQAKFNPKDLILKSQTTAPSVTEGGALDSLASLPGKVKRLRDNQPDKNELMNELLTALDRVKVAIYKLQPLTAKMNAIYRKSVTSNTRDIVMDNHKGTYAKRYPPGDYDDTYDRLHPSELLNRQPPSSSSSSSRAKRARRNQPAAPASSLESGESAENAVYLPAPKSVIDDFKQQQKRWWTSNEQQRPQQVESKSASSSFEVDTLNLGESQIIATGIGRRLGDGHVSGQLRLSSSERVYDDEDVDHKMDNAGSFSGWKALESSSKSSATNLTTNATNMATTLGGGGIGSKAPTFVRLALDETSNNNDDDDEDHVQSPLFGYRITIYQSPGSEFEQESSGDEGGRSAANERFSYQIDDGVSQDQEKSSQADEDNDADTMATSESSLIESPAQVSQQHPGPFAPASAAPVDHAASASNGSRVVVFAQGMSGGGGDALDESESLKSEKKKKEKEFMKKQQHKKKDSSSKENEEKEKESKKKSQSRKKKDEEESKKKKEYKKIKHNKGIVSKERKVMHRDKHIKAHDRGAAKEKALKERTQIEFFEREQIVDDEFEKGKKSTIKAGWQSGHDSKKTIRDTSGGSGGGGDNISLGGSHYVKHAPEELFSSSSSENGHAVSSEVSGGKKSNKFEKKSMEAKGKKFKGWREKGYKIITETEFIDRGSLHDSAYKKRDKGSAQHKKFKKQEASSEGHHGSVHEHHKKSHKKEEKKSKMHEKKEKHSAKEAKAKEEEEQKKQMKKKGKSKKKKVTGGGHRAASMARAAAVAPGDSWEGDNDNEESRQDLSKHQRSAQPMLMSASSTTFRPSAIQQQQRQRPGDVASNRQQQQQQQNSARAQSTTLLRLLNANHDDARTDHDTLLGGGSSNSSSSSENNGNNSGMVGGNLTIATNYAIANANVSHERPSSSHQQHAAAKIIAYNLSSEPNMIDESSNQSNRRSDEPAFSQKTTPVIHTKPRAQNSTSTERKASFSFPINATVAAALLGASNATTLDIVDNLTGRQINKTKIGTYELEDHHTIKLNNNNNISNNNGPVSGSSIRTVGGSNNNLATIFPGVSQATALAQHNTGLVMNLVPPQTAAATVGSNAVSVTPRTTPKLTTRLPAQQPQQQQQHTNAKRLQPAHVAEANQADVSFLMDLLQRAATPPESQFISEWAEPFGEHQHLSLAASPFHNGQLQQQPPVMLPIATHRQTSTDRIMIGPHLVDSNYFGSVAGFESPTFLHDASYV